jgi:hypothetical protein
MSTPSGESEWRSYLDDDDEDEYEAPDPFAPPPVPSGDK